MELHFIFLFLYMTNINNPWDLDLHQQHEAMQNSTPTTGEASRNEIIDEKRSEMKKTLESDDNKIEKYPWLSDEFKEAITRKNSEDDQRDEAFRGYKSDRDDAIVQYYSPDWRYAIKKIEYSWASLNEDEIRFINDCGYIENIFLDEITNIDKIDFSKLWSLMRLAIDNATNLVWSSIGEAKNLKELYCTWIQDFEGVKLPTSLHTIYTQEGGCINLVLPEGCKNYPRSKRY